MWSYAAGGASVAAAGLCTYRCYIEERADVSTRSTSRRIEAARRVDDVVRLLQYAARRAPTEDVVVHIATTLQEYGISENALHRLSAMHRHCANDDGIRGYAMAMVWSTILDGIALERIIIHID